MSVGDVNGDGFLDLFVGTFADRDPKVYQQGGAKGPVLNQLLLQNKGRFELSEQKSIAWQGRATGSVFVDFDNDGLLDLYVTNNGHVGKNNLLYHNKGAGRFELVTDKAGAPLHQPETARGIAVLDFDGDGLLDLAELHGQRLAFFFLALVVQAAFGFLLDAFQYGAPPHGGMAAGVDRIVMLLVGARNLREISLFPMNQQAADLLMGAPSEVLPKQLRELSLRVLPPDPARKA